MKTNEAPYRIYRTTTYLDSDKGKTIWKNKPVPGAENIEYVRKDAFIKKACDWIKQQQDLLEDSFSNAGDFADLLKEAMEE